MGELHPALVHLPIGILSLYTLCEFFRFGSFFRSDAWKKSKAIMVIFGVVGGIAAFTAGDALGETYRSSLLIERHETFALATLWTYGILAASYAIVFLTAYEPLMKKVGTQGLLATTVVWFKKIALGIQKPYVVLPLAALAFIWLTITGALGGAIVRGPEADPLAKIIYMLFVR